MKHEAKISVELALPRPRAFMLARRKLKKSVGRGTENTGKETNESVADANEEEELLPQTHETLGECSMETENTPTGGRKNYRIKCLDSTRNKASL